jgi:hypothetical protein
MIRIVDILKKAEDNNDKNKAAAAALKPEAPKPEAPKPEALKTEVPKTEAPSPVPPLPEEKKEGPDILPRKKLAELYEQVFGALELVLAGKSLSETIAAQGETIFNVVDSLVTQEMLGNHDLIPTLEQLKADGDFLRALKMMLHAVRIGIDANYPKGRLKELALVALASGIELGDWVRIGNFKLLTEVLGRQAKLDSQTFKNIINLAEIYERSGS